MMQVHKTFVARLGLVIDTWIWDQKVSSSSSGHGSLCISTSQLMSITIIVKETSYQYSTVKRFLNGCYHVMLPWRLKKAHCLVRASSGAFVNLLALLALVDLVMYQRSLETIGVATMNSE